LLRAAEKLEDIVQRRLVAVMPVGALTALAVEMALVGLGIRSFLVQPIADGVAALLQDGEGAAVGHWNWNSEQGYAGTTPYIAFYGNPVRFAGMSA
jgi:hypothetical protein